MAKTKRYWLVKTEPSSFSIDDWLEEPDQTTHWDGVRNYQARNLMRDDMQRGDQVLVYHSNAKPPAVVGIARVVREAYPDFTSWDPNDKHYDPKSSAESPRWFMVDLKLEKKLPRDVSLDELKKQPELAEMELLRKGSRLSVQPVRPAEFQQVVALSRRKP